MRAYTPRPTNKVVTQQSSQQMKPTRPQGNPTTSASAYEEKSTPMERRGGAPPQRPVPSAFSSSNMDAPSRSVPRPPAEPYPGRRPGQSQFVASPTSTIRTSPRSLSPSPSDSGSANANSYRPREQFLSAQTMKSGQSDWSSAVPQSDTASMRGGKAPVSSSKSRVPPASLLNKPLNRANGTPTPQQPMQSQTPQAGAFERGAVVNPRIIEAINAPLNVVPSVCTETSSYFASRLPYALEVVMKQMSSAYGAMKEQENFLQSLQVAHEKITRKFNQATASYPGPQSLNDQMTRTRLAEVSVVNGINEIGGLFHPFGSDVLSQYQKEYLDIQKEIKLAISNAEQNIIEPFKHMHSKLDRSKAKAEKALEEAFPGEIAAADGSYRENSKSKMKKTTNSNQSLILRALELTEKYNARLEIAQDMFYYYSANEIPDIMRQFEDLERRRIDKTKAMFNGIADEYQKLINGMQKKLEMIRATIDTIDSDSDLHDYVYLCEMKQDYQQNTMNTCPFEYHVAVPLERVRELCYGNEQIQQQQQQQTQLNPVATQLNNRIAQEEQQLQAWPSTKFLALLRAIEFNGEEAIKTDGIFRICSMNLQIQAASGLSNSLVDFSKIGPISASLILKNYLRSPYNPPLIPMKMYAKCLEVALDPSANVNQFLQQLPKGNLQSLGELVKLVRKIDMFKVLNKMTLRGLAIALSPCIMRSPQQNTPYWMCEIPVCCDFVEKVFVQMDCSIVEAPEVSVPGFERQEQLMQEARVPRDTELVALLTQKTYSQSSIKPPNPSQRPIHLRQRSTIRRAENGDSFDIGIEEMDIYDRWNSMPISNGWVQRCTRDGYMFYHNPSTGTSQWKSPIFDEEF